MEKISQLMDGELEAREAQQQLARIKQDEELAQCWHVFHLIGDALRGEHTLAHSFSEQVAARLTSEPTVLAPRSRVVKRVAAYALSVAASLSAVALVAWIAYFNNPLAPQPEIAKASPAPTLSIAPSSQLAGDPSDGRMNEYLIAHQEFSPSTEIQGLAPYIRGVSGTQQARGR